MAQSLGSALSAPMSNADIDSIPELLVQPPFEILYHVTSAQGGQGIQHMGFIASNHARSLGEATYLSASVWTCKCLAGCAAGVGCRGPVPRQVLADLLWQQRDEKVQTWAIRKLMQWVVHNRPKDGTYPSEMKALRGKIASLQSSTLCLQLHSRSSTTPLPLCCAGGRTQRSLATSSPLRSCFERQPSQPIVQRRTT